MAADWPEDFEITDEVSSKVQLSIRLSLLVAAKPADNTTMQIALNKLMSSSAFPDRLNWRSVPHNEERSRKAIH